MLQDSGGAAGAGGLELRWRPRLRVGHRGTGAALPSGLGAGARARLATLLCALTGITLGLAASGCIPSTQAGREVEPPPLGEQAAPVPSVRLSYQGHWSFRFGDSPRTPGGGFVWTQPIPRSEPASAGWHDAGPFRKFPGRDGNNFLWMRTRLHGPPLHEAVLYVPRVDTLVEAYLDGQLVYHFGDLSAAPPYRFIGFRAHFIPLGTHYNGKTLTLRVYSDLRDIGPFGEPRLGERAEVTTDLFIEDLGRLMSAMLLILLGITVLFLYVLRREERSYLMYGGPCA